jgi:hypothetical protein
VIKISLKEIKKGKIKKYLKRKNPNNVGKRYCELEKTHYWEEKANHIWWKNPQIG